VAIQQNAPQLGAGIGSGVSGWPGWGFDGTPPPTASDAPYVPEADLEGTIADAPSGFVAHGVSVNDLGAFPESEAPAYSRAALTSQIASPLRTTSVVNPARSADGYGLLGAGTPELMQGQPVNGPVLAYRDWAGRLPGGVVRLGIGPAVPMALLVVVAVVAVYVFTHRKGS